LKAHRPYCVLDPLQPRARLNVILEELQPELIVTDVANASFVSELSGTERQLILIDAIDNDAPAVDLAEPSSSHPAVIMYTSGSTGRPKGVVQSQQVLLHRIWFETNTSRTSIHDRISLLFSLNFGASVADVFGALLNGAALCLYDMRTDG